MAKWALEQTELFEKRFNKLIPRQVQDSFRKQIFKLAENPYAGKPISYKFFREKKIQKWRIYYLLYDQYLVLYFINISDKKLQQEVIDNIKSELDMLKKYIELKYDKKST